MNIDLSRIGRILREKREERGLSIEQVAETLCLRKTLIRAIEEGNWAPLPHEVYVRGFVKEYALLLGAHAEVAECFTAPATETNIAPVTEIPRTEKIETHKKRFPRARFLYFGVIVVVMLFFVFDKLEKDRTLTSKVQTASTVGAQRPQPETEVNNVRPVAEAKANDDADKLSAISGTKKLVIRCHERTWISVVIDGTEKKEFMLNPEEIIMLNGKDKFDLLVGNAGGVKLLLNGKDVDFAGDKGEVKRIQVS